MVMLVGGFFSQAGEVEEIYTLSGTDGTPILCADANDGSARAEWEFRVNGTVWKETLSSGFVQYQNGVEWVDSQDSPVADVWIKATQSGLSTPGDAPNVGATLNTWHKLHGSGEALRYWGWSQAGIGVWDGTIRVDISTESDGTPIVATGYYRGSALALPP